MFPDGDEKPESGIREAITAFQIYVVQVLAFYASLQGEPGRGNWQSLIFSVFAAIMLGILVGILRARPGSGSLKMHLYNSGTINLTRGLIVVISLSAGGGVLLAQNRLVPGQVHATLADMDAYKFTKSDNSEGIRLYYDIVPNLFPGGLPESLDMVIAADPRVNEIWKVGDVEGYDLTNRPDLIREFDSAKLKKLRMPLQPAVKHDPEYANGRRPDLHVFVQGLESNGLYRIRILLRPRGDASKMTPKRREAELSRLNDELRSAPDKRPLQIMFQIPKTADSK